MILTRSELETVIAGTRDPLGLLVESNIPLPWREEQGRPWLTAVTFAAQTDEALRAWYVPLGEGTPASLRGEVYEILSRRVFYTWSAPETLATVQRLCGITPAILGDLKLASQMLREPWPTRFGLSPEEQAIEVLRLAPPLRDRLGGQLAAYELEKQVAGWLMEMSAAGYQWADRRVHPIWTTVHESGSGRIVSKQPSLSNIKKTDRGNFKADPYKRWVCLSWPYADLTMAALLSGDPALRALVQTPDPYAVLGSLWGCEPLKAEQIWKHVASHGPSVPRVSEALQEDATIYIGRLVETAPQWAAWTISKVGEAPEVTTWLGRKVVVSEARKAPGAVLMESVATAQKMLLAFLRHESEFRRDGEMAGFSSVIPLYDKVFYQLDVHVPVDRHVDVVRRIGALSQVGGDFRVSISMGPSWGDLRSVDTAFGQVIADLITPPPLPVTCPVCKNTAQDWPTLEQHLLDAHHWTGDEIAGAQ